MFVLSLIIFFPHSLVSLSLARPVCFGFLSPSLVIFQFFFCVCSSFDDIYFFLCMNLSARFFLSHARSLFLSFISGVALPFPSFLPNFFTCVSSMSKNYILFSFEFLFRWRAQRVEWWIWGCTAKKGNNIFYSSQANSSAEWWVEDERERAQNDIIYLLFLDANEMKRTE